MAFNFVVISPCIIYFDKPGQIQSLLTPPRPPCSYGLSIIFSVKVVANKVVSLGDEAECSRPFAWDMRVSLKIGLLVAMILNATLIWTYSSILYSYGVEEWWLHADSVSEILRANFWHIQTYWYFCRTRSECEPNIVGWSCKRPMDEF